MHERALKLIYENNCNFEVLLEKQYDFSIHQRNLQVLVTEIYKIVNGIAKPIMNSIFTFCLNQHNLRKFKELLTEKRSTVNYSLETVTYRSAKWLRKAAKERALERSMEDFKMLLIPDQVNVNIDSHVARRSILHFVSFQNRNSSTILTPRIYCSMRDYLFVNLVLINACRSGSIVTLRGKCPNTEFFLVRSQSECGKRLTRKKSVFGHFSSDAICSWVNTKKLNLRKIVLLWYTSNIYSNTYSSFDNISDKQIFDKIQDFWHYPGTKPA